MTQKKCNHCGEWKDEEEFSWRWKSLGIRNKACKKCMYEFNKNYYQGDAHERHLQQVKERTAAADEIADVVMTCPTGALHFERLDDGLQEPQPEETTIDVRFNGPLYIRGHLQITGSGGRCLGESPPRERDQMYGGIS